MTTARDKATEFSLDQRGIQHFDFGRQKKNYEKLRDILIRNGEVFTAGKGAIITEVHDSHSGSHINLHGRKQVTFTFTSPSLRWYKYENGSAQSGTNHVYLHGLKIRTTDFLRLPDTLQDQMLISRKDAEEIAYAHHIKQ